MQVTVVAAVVSVAVVVEEVLEVVAMIKAHPHQ